MKRTVSEQEFETAMQAWARETIDVTTPPPFTVHEADHSVGALRDRRGRHGLPLLAAALVLVLVGAGLTIRYAADQKRITTPTQRSARRNVRHAYLAPSTPDAPELRTIGHCSPAQWQQ